MDDFKENLKEKTKYNELKIEATADKIQNKASDVIPFNYLTHWSILKECMLLKEETVDASMEYLLSCTQHQQVVTWRCPVKKVLLKISQNSQGNICSRISFSARVCLRA